jgi:hypothetical protein
VGSFTTRPLNRWGKSTRYPLVRRLAMGKIPITAAVVRPVTLLLYCQSSVCAALGYGLEDRGSRVRFPAGAGNFFFTNESRTALGPTQPPIKWVPGALSLGLKRQGREADHSPPSSAEVKNAWSYISTLQYVFMAW